MKSGLGTITIIDDGHCGHVAYELSERDGLLFAGEELLIKAKKARAVTLQTLFAGTEYRIRVGSVEASCANFLILT
jgi:hypothetical protein